MDDILKKIIRQITSNIDEMLLRVDCLLVGSPTEDLKDSARSWLGKVEQRFDDLQIVVNSCPDKMKKSVLIEFGHKMTETENYYYKMRKELGSEIVPSVKRAIKRLKDKYIYNK
jgi:hypothetical protein